MGEILVIFMWLVVAAVAIYFIFWALGKATWPDPIKTVATTIVIAFIVILCVIVLISALQRAGLLSAL
jgi:hypothetical protein